MTATITIMNNECKRAIQRALDKITDLREKIEDGKVTRPEHLSSEFFKWSNRINALPAGDEREFAQAMLNSIAEARNKYNIN